jgi:hypothetical protein
MDQSPDYLNQILQQLEQHLTVESLPLAKSFGIAHQDLVGYLNKLAAEFYVNLQVLQINTLEPLF